MRGELGWIEAAPGPLATHRHRKGTILGLPAPPGQLLAATALAEWALQAAAVELGVPHDPASLDPDALPLEEAAALAELRTRAEAEDREPRDELLFETPPGLPVALVTGSNGKTTTTRLLAGMLRDHGHTVGYTSTDGVQVGERQVERGDWSGPLGAARVLGDSAVTAAVLETARGGLLRRGLVVRRANVAVITNVAEDHFGEYAVDTLDDLARVKGLVARALGPGGVLVLNGDDPRLSPAGPEDAGIPPCIRLGEARIEVRRFSLARPWPAWLPPVEEIPITAGGLARYNAANALAAALAARALGVPDEGIAGTLRHFGTRPEDNPGRLVREEVGGITVFFDYAHNPAGLAGLLEVARGGVGASAGGAAPETGPAATTGAAADRTRGRLLLLLGQAGDREDEAIRALARAAWAAHPDRVILREVEGYTRGRASGEVPAILAEELLGAGADPGRLHTCLDEREAVREALAWARPGDLLVLPIHGLASREYVLALVAALRAAGWRAGEALPPTSAT
jgi:UDP-N-acetylmuramyl tripeptide synthase